MKISPLAPATQPVLRPISGVQLAACEAGIRYKGRKDLMLCSFAPGTTVAGVLTKSKTASAPVELCRKNLQNGTARALIVNAGNANAFTGMRGQEAVQKTIEAVTSNISCTSEEVFVASTGVIGEPLKPDIFTTRLAELTPQLNDHAWHDIAEAIMTTDTYPKLATEKVLLDGKPITINGIAKGSGMIAPDMATMLSFIFTDAPIASGILQSLCTQAVNKSFNAITVDSDTSTSDTVLLFATGAAVNLGVREINSLEDQRTHTFSAMLEKLMLNLAHQIVRDGEGASKFIAIHITGAENDQAARNIGLAIANSPLVKTACAGEDPNWGRIVMAVGKAGEAANRDKLAIRFGDIVVAVNGEVHPDYKEEYGAAYMKREKLDIHVDIGIAKGDFTIWTCDLTHDYITINADYRS